MRQKDLQGREQIRLDESIISVRRCSGREIASHDPTPERMDDSRSQGCDFDSLSRQISVFRIYVRTSILSQSEVIMKRSLNSSANKYHYHLVCANLLISSGSPFFPPCVTFWVTLLSNRDVAQGATWLRRTSPTVTRLMICRKCSSQLSEKPFYDVHVQPRFGFRL